MQQPGGDTLHLRITVDLKKSNLEVKTKVSSPGGGGGASLWKADEAEGGWAVQGNQAHLQRPKHNPGKINFHSLKALKRKELKIWLLQLKVKACLQVIFHARKKLRLQRLKELAAARTADQLLSLRSAEQLAAEGLIPAALVQDLILAYLDTWTQRLAETPHELIY